jgi:hypothetical protein
MKGEMIRVGLVEGMLEAGVRTRALSQGWAEVLLVLLSEKFGSLPEGMTEVIQSAGMPELRRLSEGVLSASTLSDVMDS